MKSLHEELLQRLKEIDYLHDARVKTAVSGLTEQEVKVLVELADLPAGGVRGWGSSGTVLSVREAGVARLLDKRLIAVAGQFEEMDFPAYLLTPLGRQVANIAKSGLQKFKGTLLQNPEPDGKKS